MSTTLGKLAELIGGRLVGDPGLPISGAATLDSASAGDISFVDDTRLLDRVQVSPAAAMVVADEFPAIDRPAIFVDDPREAFARIVMSFRPPVEMPDVGVSPAARIDPTAQLEEGVQIHAGAVIGPNVRIGRGSVIHSNVAIMPGCEVGSDVILFPNVVLYEGTVIGDRCLIHAGAVIGAYGFGYDTVQGRHDRGPQLGYVLIESDVEIGACTTIDRGTYGSTVVGEGTKIDNQVMIAHNCQIGRHNLICSQVGVAGSSSSGDYVVMAGQVGVPDHVRIGNRAVLGAKAGIMRDVPDDTTVLGIPATPERDQMAKQAAFARLPEMRKQLRKLQRVVDQIAASLGQSEARKSQEAA